MCPPLTRLKLISRGPCLRCRAASSLKPCQAGPDQLPTRGQVKHFRNIPRRQGVALRGVTSNPSSRILRSTYYSGLSLRDMDSPIYKCNVKMQ